jgi:hypothetical protein
MLASLLPQFFRALAERLLHFSGSEETISRLFL